jgi:alpha-glucosidase
MTPGRLLAAAMIFATPSFVLAQSVGEIAPGVYRFDSSEDARKRSLPSFSFEDPLRREVFVAPTGAAREKPSFESEEGRTAVRIAIEPGTSLYGTGMAAGRLLRNGRTVTCWNTDAYGYDDASPSLYQSHPWVLAVRADGSAFGVLADTTYRCVVDLTDGIKFVADNDASGAGLAPKDGVVPGSEFPVIVIEGKTPQEVIVRLTDLTGRITMPPLWAIGYHQCRYSYYPDTQVMEVARAFRNKKIPCDVIWHDIDYMDQYRCFTFSPKDFPDPERHNADLHALHFRTVWMIDPGIAADETKFGAGGYPVYDQVIKGGHATQNSAGEVYRGEVWPGMCVFPDYMRRETREWWAGLYPAFMARGIDGVWNDMNEPAVFNVKSKTMPVDNIHRADAELGGTGPHARYHNVYGMHMVMGTRDGALKANPEKRPFVLSRANFIGGHRYAACWTGDNTANWYHLESSIPMVLNLGLSGQPFTGPDIGGFAGNGDAALFSRWMGFGAMFPFARGHTGKENIQKEPWAFGEEVEKTCRAAIEQRYMLLPYFYTLFHEASVSGLPVARPVFFADPADPALRSEDDSFLLGSDLLVVCDTTPDADRARVMPKGDWQRVTYVDEKVKDLPELYLRDGAIVPSGPVMQHTGERALDWLTLTVNLTESGEAEGVLYEDAGEGWGYREGDYSLIKISAKRTGEAVRFEFRRDGGTRSSIARQVSVRLVDKGRIMIANAEIGAGDGQFTVGVGTRK